MPLTLDVIPGKRLRFRLEGALAEPRNLPRWQSATDAERARFYPILADVLLSTWRDQMLEGVGRRGRIKRALAISRVSYTQAGLDATGPGLLPQRELSRAYRLARVTPYADLGRVTGYWATNFGGRILSLHHEGLSGRGRPYYDDAGRLRWAGIKGEVTGIYRDLMPTVETIKSSVAEAGRIWARQVGASRTGSGQVPPASIAASSTPPTAPATVAARPTAPARLKTWIGGFFDRFRGKPAPVPLGPDPGRTYPPGDHRTLGVEFGASVHARGGSHETVLVDVRAVDAAWQRDEAAYIGPGGTGSAIPGRYERFGEFLSQAQSGGAMVEMSEVSSEGGNLVFRDGRHRFANLRDQGVRHVPVRVPSGEAAALRRRFGWSEELPVGVSPPPPPASGGIPRLNRLGIARIEDLGSTLLAESAEREHYLAGLAETFEGLDAGDPGVVGRSVRRVNLQDKIAGAPPGSDAAFGSFISFAKINMMDLSVGAASRKQSSGRLGVWPPVDEHIDMQRSTVVHEFGHAIDADLRRRGGKAARREILDAIRPDAGKISNYATTSDAELFAEAFNSAILTPADALSVPVKRMQEWLRARGYDVDAARRALGSDPPGGGAVSP